MTRTTLLCSAAAMLAVLATNSARADYDGVETEWDEFALDGVTPLIDLPGYAGQGVLNVYATFTSPADQCVGVVGSPSHPFKVETLSGSGFVNSPRGADTPPLQALVRFFPPLNWDSFFTVGLFVTGPNDELIVAPGTPGPNSDPWGGFGGNSNMAWAVPPTLDGVPTPQSLAGPDGRVLVMRLVVPNRDIHIEGSFGLLVFQGAVADEIAAGFSTLFPCFGACCNAKGDLCVSFLDERDCKHAGGVFLGCNVPCSACPLLCPSDVDDDGFVDVSDLTAVILAWGACGGCPEDVNRDGLVDRSDMILVVLAWGTCPS